MTAFKLAFVVSLLIGCYAHAKLPPLNYAYGTAGVRVNGSQLHLWTGKCSAIWQQTESGLALASIEKGERHGWAFDVNNKADWDIPGVTVGPAKLVTLTANENDDDGFTNKHLEVVVEFYYEQSKTHLQYRVWAYPKAPGLRVQIWLKAAGGFQPAEFRDEARVFSLHTAVSRFRRGVATYSKHNSGRAGRFEQFPMMKEEASSGPLTTTKRYEKAGLLKLLSDDSTLLVVKEAPAIDSPVRVDEQARKQRERERIGWSPYRIGGFEISANRVAVTGAGIAASDLVQNQWRQAYATWLVIADANETQQQLAVKRYDRYRFPFDWKRDWYIGANNWGSTSNARLGQISSKEPSILKEIEAAYEMGIEMVQIDDGWQSGMSSKLNPRAYPQGWTNVRTLAEERSIRLGLWQGWVQKVSVPRLIDELNAGEFKAVKLDFYNTSSFDKLQQMRDIARQIHQSVNNPIVINWDTTGTQSKDQGFFYGREYGNLWIENQKEHMPDHTLYRPWRVLRDAWDLSHYVNLDQIQIPIQNPDRLFANPSDASLHSQSYCTAIGLMGSPNFFQELKYQTTQARHEIRALLDIYKRARPEMAQGIVYPIGDRPKNGSWTGFQNYEPSTQSGYLTVFRELHNNSSTHKLDLRFIAGREIRVTNLLTGQRKSLTVGPKGELDLEIPEAPGFLFLKYESTSSPDISQVSEHQKTR